jgi:hypothetical protein
VFLYECLLAESSFHAYDNHWSFIV